MLTSRKDTSTVHPETSATLSSEGAQFIAFPRLPWPPPESSSSPWMAGPAPVLEKVKPLSAERDGKNHHRPRIRRNEIRHAENHQVSKQASHLPTCTSINNHNQPHLTNTAPRPSSSILVIGIQEKNQRSTNIRRKKRPWHHRLRTAELIEQNFGPVVASYSKRLTSPSTRHLVSPSRMRSKMLICDFYC